MDQVNELLRNELAMEFMRSLALPEGVIASVTKVRTAPNLQHATVYVSIMPDKHTGTALAQIRKQLPSITKAIAPKLNLRKFPKVRIASDEAERSAAHIESILDSLLDTE